MTDHKWSYTTRESQTTHVCSGCGITVQLNVKDAEAYSVTPEFDIKKFLETASTFDHALIAEIRKLVEIDNTNPGHCRIWNPSPVSLILSGVDDCDVVKKLVIASVVES